MDGVFMFKLLRGILSLALVVAFFTALSAERDAVGCFVDRAWTQVGDMEWTKEALHAQLPQLRQLANHALRKLGFDSKMALEQIVSGTEGAAIRSYLQDALAKLENFLHHG